MASGDGYGGPMKQPTDYSADQRAFHDSVVTETWHTFNWERRALREAFDVEQIFKIAGPAVLAVAGPAYRERS